MLFRISFFKKKEKKKRANSTETNSTESENVIGSESPEGDGNLETEKKDEQ